MIAKEACGRCGRKVAKTPSGHYRAHACPHGRPCVLSYKQRRAAPGKAAKCSLCASDRMTRAQVPLFGDE